MLVCAVDITGVGLCYCYYRCWPCFGAVSAFPALTIIEWHCSFLLVAKLCCMLAVAFQHVSDLHNALGVAGPAGFRSPVHPSNSNPLNK